jgi:hypothetical protein
MYYLIYVSSARPSFDLAQIEQMLIQARAKNRRLGITGLLVHRSGNFMQYIEGDTATVKGLYATIVADTRHRGCVVLAEGEMRERQFADWDMNFRQAFGQPLFTTPELAIDGEGIKATLTRFVHDMR